MFGKLLTCFAVLVAGVCSTSAETIVVEIATGATVTVDRHTTPEDYAALLAPLAPLPKRHYSWALPMDQLMEHPPLLSEYVRITGAASLAAVWAPREHYEQLKPFLDQHNAKLGLNYSPLHRAVSPAGELLDLQTEVEADIAAFIASMDQVKTWTDELGITVGCVLLDSERFRAKTGCGTSRHNDYLTATYDRFHDHCTNLWPDVRVVWYGRGAVQPSAHETGWRTSTRFTLCEHGVFFSCSLYHPGNHYLNQEVMRRTHHHAAEHGSPPIVPWVSLGAGYVPQLDRYHEFDFNSNYNLIYSWKLGAELNHPWFGDRPERFAPWHAVEFAIFYPEPFGRTTNWGRHFVAYVRGAHLIQELP